MKLSLRVPKGWHFKPLGEVAVIRSGSVNPSRFPTEIFELFSIPAFDNFQKSECLPGSMIKSNKTMVESGDCLFSKLNPRICRVWIVPQSEGNRKIASTEFLPIFPKIKDAAPWFIPEFVAYLLAWRGFREEFVGQVEASTKSRERLKPAQLLEQDIPLPPIPVQERIVQILHKADEIRCKRKEALEMADKVLSALFLEIFGDPSQSDNLNLMGTAISSIRNGLSRRRKDTKNEGQIVLRIQDVGDGYIDFGNVNRISLLEAECKAFTLQAGDMLLVRVNGNKNLVGRNAFFRGFEEPVAHNDHLMRITFDPNKVLPEYVAAFLRTSFGKQELKSKVATSAGNYTINQDGFASIRIPLPQLNEQKKFLMAVNQHAVCRMRLVTGTQIANKIFDSIISRAFTGELTIEWEAANAQWIANRQAYYERLPRLLLVALLAEKAKSVSRNADDSLLTSLIKYALLLKVEGTSRQQLYQFVPNHYGPLAKELYVDLEKLQEEGLVVVDKGIDEEKTQITLKDPEKAEQALSELPDDLKEDVTTIIERYGHLDHNALLKTVYDKYPAYAKKSQLRRKRK